MQYLANNIKHLRNLKEQTQEQFAQNLNVSRSRISSYEENRAIPPIDFLAEISNYFAISIDMLVKNDLTKIKDAALLKIGNDRLLFPITINEDDEEMIELVPIEASAGYLRGYSDPEYIEHLSKIK